MPAAGPIAVAPRPVTPESIRAQYTLTPLLAPPPRVDLQHSRRLARAVGARNGNCYVNAVRALLHGGPLVREACYVEGIVVVDFSIPLPFDHGWLESADGEILDPTSAYHADGATPRCYFGIARYARAEVLRQIATAADPSRIMMPFLSGRGGWGQELPEWGPAQVAALRHRSALHLHRHGAPLITPEAEADTLASLLGWWSRHMAEDLSGSNRDTTISSWPA